MGIRKKVILELAQKGISSPKLFDIAEQRILNTYQDESDENLEILYWLIRAIGFSGNSKYKASLMAVSEKTTSKDIKSNIAEVLEILPKYEAWNSQLGKGIETASEDNIDRIRIANALSAEDMYLVKMGSKMLYRSRSDNHELLKVAEQVVLNNYLNESTRDQYAEALSWICKSLGEFGQGRYHSTLSKVANNAASKKVRKYAERYSS